MTTVKRSTSVSPVQVRPTGLRGQRGISLLEVLVSVVIIAFGLLGVGAMHLNGMKNNHSAMLRSQATVMAYDILDRMRVNRVAIANYSTNDAYVGCPSEEEEEEEGGAAPTNDYVTLASSEVTEWGSSLCNRLPSGSGKVTVDTANKRVVVNVRWNDGRGVEQDTEKTLSAEMQYCDAPCYF